MSLVNQASPIFCIQFNLIARSNKLGIVTSIATYETVFEIKVAKNSANCVSQTSPSSSFGFSFVGELALKLGHHLVCPKFPNLGGAKKIFSKVGGLSLARLKKLRHVAKFAAKLSEAFKTDV